MLDNGENFIVDIKEPFSKGGDFLYKKGEKPMEFSMFQLGFDNDESSWKKIGAYFGMKWKDMKAMFEDKHKDTISEHTSKIHKNVPDLLFRAMGNKDDGDISVTELIIVNSETKEVINKINLLDYTVDNTPPFIKDVSEIKFIDVNFDGYKDIQLFDRPNGNWNEHYLYFVWDKGKNKYVPDTQGLDELGLPQFDEEKQLVFSMQRSSATDHWYYTHKYIKGVLTVIEEKSENAVWFKEGVTDEQLAAIVPILSEYPSNTFMYIAVKKLNQKTSKMEIVEAKYQLYVPNEWTLIEEYDANSDIGKQLEKLIDR
jgi:hypothetical protein